MNAASASQIKALVDRANIPYPGDTPTPEACERAVGVLFRRGDFTASELLFQLIKETTP